MYKKIFNKSTFIDIFFIIIGSFMGSIGINMFLTHAHLLSGGVAGIALIIQYLFSIKAGYIVFILNIPLFAIGIKNLDKKFVLYSLIGTLTLSTSLVLTQPITNLLYINDKLLYCIYGGVINGIGYGLVFTHHGSTGGMDIISMLIKRKYSSFNIGKINFSINFIIVTISAFVFGLPSALYTLISMYIASFVLDYVIKGFNNTKCVMIVTENEEEIKDYIVNSLHRGVTFLYGEGAFTKKGKRVIYCIVSLTELFELKKTVNLIDDRAFFTIFDASEVQGKGFKNVI